MINPKPEHRLTFLEKQFVAMGGHLEGIQEDIETLDQGMKSSFDKIGDAFTLLDSNIETLKVDIKNRFDKVEDDIAELKGLIKQIIQQKSDE